MPLFLDRTRKRKRRTMDYKNKCVWERYASRYEILKNSDTYLCTLTTRYNPVTIFIPTDECAYKYDKTKCPFFKKKKTKAYQ